jgi:hypothetical protein
MQIPKYKISFFENCYSNTANEKELSFDEILDYFRKAARREFVTKEHLEAMICGTLIEQKRTTESLTCRSIITYDIDYYKHNLDMLLTYIKECLKDNTYICYTTASSTFEKPRVRILVFVNKTMTADEYRVVSLNVAKTLFKEFFNSDIGKIDDVASYSPCYLMYLPIIREVFKTLKNDGEPLDITEYLNLEIKEETTEIQEFVKTAKNTPLSITDDRVREVLAEYNVEDTDRDSWLKVCQGLHHQYRGSEEGYKLFLEWSLTDTRFSEDKIRTDSKSAYYSLKSNRSNPITFASTIAIVNDKKKLPVKVSIENKEPPKSINYNYFVHTKENKDGKITGIKSTYENFEIMCNYYKIEVAYDKIGKDKINSLEQDANSFVTTIKSLMVLNNMDKGMAKEFCDKMALLNEKNIFKVTMDNTIWDGVSRLEEFYNTIEVDKELEGTRNLYLLKWCQQMLYQALFEGDKKIARNILILKGKQNIGKSTWVKQLLPLNLQKYIGQGMALNTNDDMSKLAVLKNLIVELAELEQSFKKTDINQFKSFFGVTKDTINIKYVAEPVTFERTTSFIGTINDDTFLKDRSGSTRFLVLLVNKLNGFHKIDMLQLYKEILETTDYCNFELNEVERESQREINEEFEQPNLLEETFLDNFELDFKEGGDYMNCSEMLKQLSLGVKDFTYNRKADIKHIVDKYKFKYRKDLKKWLVKIKQGDN